MAQIAQQISAALVRKGRLTPDPEIFVHAYDWKKFEDPSPIIIPGNAKIQ